jgi:type II secretion system protein H
MRCNRASWRKRRGFSVVELLIVIAILGIVSTIAIVNTISALPHTNLEKAEEEVGASLAQARTLAISKEVAVRFLFDVSGQYWYEQQDRDTGTWSIATPGAGKQVLPTGITLTVNSFPSQVVSFTPRGTLTVGGTLTFTNSKGETGSINGDVATGRFPVTGGNTR